MYCLFDILLRGMNNDFRHGLLVMISGSILSCNEAK